MAAAVENLIETLQTLAGFATYKIVKVVVEISNIALEILQTTKPNLANLIIMVPFLKHTNAEVKKPIVDLCVSA